MLYRCAAMQLGLLLLHGSACCTPLRQHRLQVIQPPHLAQLRLHGCDHSAASTAALSRLHGSLTRLDLEHTALPASLPSLTRLRHLQIQFSPPQADLGSVLDTALSALQQLTCLVSVAAPLGWLMWAERGWVV